MATAQMTVRLPEEKKEQLDKLAEERGTQPAALARELLIQALSQPQDLALLAARVEKLCQRLTDDAGEVQVLMDKLLDEHPRVPPAG